MALLINGEQFKSESAVATNSLVTVSGDFVCKSASGFATVNTVADNIIWIAHTVNTFDADNQTVDMDRVIYAAKNTWDIMRVEVVADATITIADEGKFYNINTNGTVDVATASVVQSYTDASGASATAALVTYQLELIRFVSTAASIYRII